MQSDDQKPPGKVSLHLGNAIFQAPLFAVFGMIVFPTWMSALIVRDEVTVAIWTLLTLSGPFFAVFPWARANSCSSLSAVGKALGVSILICVGWVLLFLAFSFAVCGRR